MESLANLAGDPRFLLNVFLVSGVFFACFDLLLKLTHFECQWSTNVKGQ